MIGKLPKSEAWKQSDPDRPGLLVHPRYLSRDSLSEFIGFLWIPTELPHSSKLDLRNPIRPQRIPAFLPCSSYKEGSRQARRPSSPQSLSTLPTRLRLATTLRMGAFQVESPKYGVFQFPLVGGIYRGPRRGY
jgi:hypothetical protein